jgi:hypothetical protein
MGNTAKLQQEFLTEEAGQQGQNNSVQTNGQENQSATPVYDFTEFNKTLGREFKSFDDFKPLIEVESKWKQYEPKIPVWEQLEKDHSSLKEQYSELEKLAKIEADPLKPYGGKKERYIETHLEEKYPEQSHLIKEVMSLDKKSPIETIVLEKMWANPDTSREEIIEYLKERYNDADIDELGKVDPKDWPEGIRFKVKEDARLAKGRLGGIPSEIQVPEYVDPTLTLKQKQEEKAVKEEQNAVKWKELTADPKFTEVELGEFKFVQKDSEGKEIEPFVWKVEPEVLTQMTNVAIQLAKFNGFEPTEENKKSIVKHLRTEYIANNIERIMEQRDKQNYAAWEIKNAQENHVPERRFSDEGHNEIKPDVMEEHYTKKRGIK